MISPTYQFPYRNVVRTLIVLAIAQAILWFAALGPIMEENSKARFLAATDAGSFLVPAACLFFRGAENKDFVRGVGTIRGTYQEREVCWYTRDTFTEFYPELQSAFESITVMKQAARMMVDIYRPDGGAFLLLTARRSLHIGLAFAMLAGFFIVLAKYAPGTPLKKGDWQWRRRERWYFGR
ncbi:MAG: hypothetical protein JWL86_3826 [Rhizobium sp.]|nr:hypothetical protein [Rhizobium sp.]